MFRRVFMGFGPAPASKKLLSKLGLSIDDMDVIELNEAFAAQGLAVTRDLGLADDADHVNPNGGAISLGHPLGMSGRAYCPTRQRVNLSAAKASMRFVPCASAWGQGYSNGD